MLRRHHCRRCGNVFCDTCSSARMPLVHSNFHAPVRVCAKCSVAAKKAHAKMVQQRQTGQVQVDHIATQRRHSDTTGGRGETGASGRTGSFVLMSDQGTGGLFYEQEDSMTRVGRMELMAKAMDDRRDGSSLFIGRDVGSRDSATSSFQARNGDIFTSNGRRRRRQEEQVQPQLQQVLLSALPAYQRDVLSGSFTDRERTTSDETDDGGAQNMNHGTNRYGGGRFQTLPGEAVLVRNDDVRLRFFNHVEHVGRLYVTNFRLVFSPERRGSVQEGRGARCELERARGTRNTENQELVVDASGLHATSYEAYQAIPLVTIERVKRKEMVETDSGLLEVVGKDFRRLQFVFEGLVSKQTFSKFDRSYMLARLHALGEPEGKVDEFAKFSLERFDGINGIVDGWKIFDAVTEFQRMGISTFTDRWRLSYINDEYDLCPTYPSVLAVPAAASDRVLAVASKFRSKGRIPVLSWRDRHTGAVICRSSQPLVGLGQKQCDKDVFLIQAIAATNPSSTKLVIIDARPWRNAVAQKTVGRAGYELTEHYETRHATAKLKYADMVASEHNAAAAAAISAVPAPETMAETSADRDLQCLDRSFGSNGSDSGDGGRHTPEATKPSLVLTECKLIFMGIENIHTMRKSYHKLMDLCTTKQNNDKWLDQLASTHWMDHISRILESAVEIARIVKEQKSSVLIHCSDGWDRTAQLTSLTEVLVDPHYRTVVGFQLLIEKEWCSFGHKFRDRTAHGTGSNSNEFSPIFLQWMDCVWQVLVQFPSAFEFNERYLILILDHLYSCRFGTFLYNSERERLEQESIHPTQSLWSYLSTIDHAIVVNPFYRAQTASRTMCQVGATATGRQCLERTSAPSYGSLPNERVRNGFDLFARSDTRCDFATEEACKSTGSVHLSPLRPKTDLADTGAGAHFEPDAQRHCFGNDGFPRRGNGLDRRSESDTINMQSPCHHKLVIMRDLDSGFSFPQSLDASSISKFTSPPPVAPRSRSFNFCSSSGDGAAVGRGLTPHFRSSMTPFVVSAEELSANAMWTTPGTENAAETDETGRYNDSSFCEDVIIPSSSMKSLHFWVHYYLRWDPNSHFDRDASVELEALHLGLILQIKALMKQIDIVREDEAGKWELKMQTQCLFDSQNRCDCIGTATNTLSPSRGRYRCNGRAISIATEVKDAVASSRDLETQIARLKSQKLRRLREAEEIYQEELTRLLQEAD
uniref:phosphatidylinositol-3,5-bisphosphate 3-phosphatase n=1 Tax=Hyaloperonospora arabidopsidis (strain Emoy2) TaxID=559515 RepID=M4C073_HYAAE